MMFRLAFGMSEKVRCIPPCSHAECNNKIILPYILIRRL